MATDLVEWCDVFARKCVVNQSWETVIMFIWQVWCMRNSWVLERKKIDPVLACWRTMNYLGEFHSAASREADHKPSVEKRNQKWQPPVRSLYKINSDAAMTVDGKISLGMVVRDRVGDVLMSAGSPITSSILAIQAEAKPVLFGLKYGYDAGLRSVEVESDCLNLVELLQARTRMRSTTQVVVNDILNVARTYELCYFGFASRICNKVAHSIAKAAIYFDETLVWMEECPDDVLPLVQADKLSTVD